MALSRCTTPTMARHCGLPHRSNHLWRGAAFRKILTLRDGLGSTFSVACPSLSLPTVRCGLCRPDHLCASTTADCARRCNTTRSREPIARLKNDHLQLLQKRKRPELWSGKPYWTACVIISSLMSQSALSYLREWIPAPWSV